MDDRQQEYLKKSTDRYRAGFKKCFEGHIARNLAIKLKCIDCVGQEDVVSAIRECGITVCPLYQYRPFIERPKTTRKGNPKFGAKKTAQDTP